MKLGILGGSFNPFHPGHLYLARKALSELKLDRVVFVPAYCSPFKQDAKAETTAKDRIDMLASSILGDPRFAIDACEIRREGVSYTINTLEDILDRYLPDGKPALIIGDDCANDFLKWRECERILQLADVAVARRMNTEDVKYPFEHIIIKNEVMVLSSNEIRSKIAASAQGEKTGWQELVTSRAKVIIEGRGLYGCCGTVSPEGTVENIENREAADNTIQQVEAAALESLSTERFLHSRHTALMCYDFCLRFNIDPMYGYLAGIAHDLAKQTDNKLLLKIVKDDGQKISDLEKERPNLLHGRAAAVLLRERFNINNKEVIDAVAVHTSGCEDMGTLAKILYIADKTEVTRIIEPSLRKMCAAASSDEELDRILLAVIEKTMIKLKSKEQVVSKDTLKLLKKVKERLN
ncbi:MAG: nicotinate (nicotinamide) nucleotide adenylyltransferase [Treponema sp.]|nr:nicotinate (nicotinamide) nucleotide adenylyltransferase [Treponema sp.]